MAGILVFCVLAFFGSGIAAIVFLEMTEPTVAVGDGVRLERKQVDKACAQLPACDADDPTTVEPLIGRMVERQIVDAAAAEHSIQIPDEQVARHLFDTFRTPDDRFDEAAMKRLIAAQGMTKPQFHDSVRDELRRDAVVAALEPGALEARIANVARTPW